MSGRSTVPVDWPNHSPAEGVARHGRNNTPPNENQAER